VKYQKHNILLFDTISLHNKVGTRAFNKDIIYKKCSLYEKVVFCFGDGGIDGAGDGAAAQP
jgi:hypothetical protein